MSETTHADQVRAYIEPQTCYCSEEPDGEEGFRCSRCKALDHLETLEGALIDAVGLCKMMAPEDADAAWDLIRQYERILGRDGADHD